MCEECAPPIPVARLLGRSGFGDAIGCVEASYSNDIQEITFLVVSLMWNDASVCGGRVRMICFVRVWLDIWKSLERESVMMFYVPLICCEYRNV